MRDRSRRLAILDVMLLVAALAVAYGIYQAYMRMMGGRFRYAMLFGPLVRGEEGRDAVERVFLALAHFGAPIAGGLAGMLPLLRLRPPRPRWRRLMRQPGFVACLAVWAGVAVVAPCFGLMFGLSGVWAGRMRLPAFYWVDRFAGMHAFSAAGVAVAIAWLFQALSGRWRPVPDPIDRLGRLVGLYWIAAGLAAECWRYGQMM